jgi:hypothetical protein
MQVLPQRLGMVSILGRRGHITGHDAVTDYGSTESQNMDKYEDIMGTSIEQKSSTCI